MACAGDVTKEADFARDLDLWQDRLCAVDGFAPFEAIEAVGDSEIAISVRRWLRTLEQLPVIEIKHADRKQEDERADEQSEIQV